MLGGDAEGYFRSAQPAGICFITSGSSGEMIEKWHSLACRFDPFTLGIGIFHYSTTGKDIEFHAPLPISRAKGAHYRRLT